MKKEQGKWIAGDTLCKQGEDLREIVEESLKHDIPIYHPTEKRAIFSHTALKEIAQFTYQGKSPYFLWESAHQYDTLIIPDNLFQYFDVEWNGIQCNPLNGTEKNNFPIASGNFFSPDVRCLIYIESRERGNSYITLFPKFDMLERCIQNQDEILKYEIRLVNFANKKKCDDLSSILPSLYLKEDNTEKNTSNNEFMLYLLDGIYENINYSKVDTTEKPLRALDYDKILIPVEFRYQEKSERICLKEINNFFHIEYTTVAEKSARRVVPGFQEKSDKKRVINPRDIARERLGKSNKKHTYSDKESDKENEYADFLYHNEFDYIKDNNKLDLGEDYFIFDEEQYCKLYYYFDRKNGKINYYNKLKEFRYCTKEIESEKTGTSSRSDKKLNSGNNSLAPWLALKTKAKGEELKYIDLAILVFTPTAANKLEDAYKEIWQDEYPNDKTKKRVWQQNKQRQVNKFAKKHGVAEILKKNHEK